MHAKVTSVMSDSLKPYGLQPTRFLCPRDSPGMPFSRDLPNPGIELASLMSPALASKFFTTSAIGEAPTVT